MKPWTNLYFALGNHIGKFWSQLLWMHFFNGRLHQSPSNKVLRWALFMKLNLRICTVWAGCVEFIHFLYTLFPTLRAFWHLDNDAMQNLWKWHRSNVTTNANFSHLRILKWKIELKLKCNFNYFEYRSFSLDWLKKQRLYCEYY